MEEGMSENPEMLRASFRVDLEEDLRLGLLFDCVLDVVDFLGFVDLDLRVDEDLRVDLRVDEDLREEEDLRVDEDLREDVREDEDLREDVDLREDEDVREDVVVLLFLLFWTPS